MLQMLVCRALNLRKADWFGKNDVYVQCYYPEGMVDVSTGLPEPNRKAVLPPGVEPPEAPLTIRGGGMNGYDGEDTSLAARLAKLDRLEPILAKLEALTRTMPTSERGGKSAFKSGR